MGKAKKGRKFAAVKRIINPKDSRIKKAEKQKKSVVKKKDKDEVRNIVQNSSALFLQYNTQLGPPYHVLIDTNFINFSIKNKLDIIQSLMDCLYAKCTPYITDCVMGELEKLGLKYRLALKIAKDERFERLPCMHKGIYADDCLVNRVTQHKCYIVATCDRDLKRRIRKIPGVPIMFISQRRYTIERMPDAFGGSTLHQNEVLFGDSTFKMWDVLDEAVVERVKRAIETELSPYTSQADRRSARELTEKLKNESTYSASIGLTLYANFENSNEVRYIGLRFVEDYIKKRWNELPVDEKHSWKKEAIFLMAALKMSEVNHIKEALARITVEIAKREFPQNWDSFLPELGTVQTKGPAQLEVTLIVFLRLAEDVMLSLDPHIHTQRRRNIEQALGESMSDIFTFFIKTLQDNVGAWQRSHEKVNHRLAEATLFALGVYLGHAAVEHVFANSSVLLQMICQLLNDDKLKAAAADCLLVFVERRRDRIDIRSKMLVLFSDDAMDLFVEVAGKACMADVEEDEYRFLKKICDIIVSLGSCQLADIWGNDRGIKERPKTFEKYMKLLLDMMSHPSQVICLKVLAVYSTFLKHEVISKDDIFIDSIPYFVSAFGEKLPRFGDINDDNHPSCKYSVMDHDSTSEFMESFSKLRSTLCICIRDCTNILPLHCFEHFCRTIMELVQKQEVQYDVILWDAIGVFSDAVLSRVWKSELFDLPAAVLIERGKTVDMVAMANEVLKSLIQLQVKIPQVMSHVLICIQAFFPFFRKSQDNLMGALQKIMITFSNYPLEDSSKEFLSTRRQATGCFVNLCKQDSTYLLQYFELFQQFVSRLEENKEITYTEYHTLLEGLLLLNNSMPSNREDFILNQIRRLDGIISKSTFIKSLESTDNFINFLGFGEICWDDPQPRENRYDLSTFMGVLAAIIRRVQLTESEKSSHSVHGSFGKTTESTWIQRLLHHLPILAQVIKHIGCMWAQSTQMNVNKSLASAFRLNNNDRLFLLGQHILKEIKESWDRSSCVANKASVYIHNLHTQSYSALGHFGGFLAESFYNKDDLADILISNVIFSWGFLPLYRLVTVFKSFFKPFLSSCPTNCFTKAIAPTLSVTLKSMLELLSKEWAKYKERMTTAGNSHQSQGNDDSPSDQVIEERLIYTLSREYIETLVSCFFVKNKGKDASVSEEDIANPDPGDLGNFILQCKATNTHYIFTLFEALTWPDTAAVNKISRVIPHIVKFISQLTTEYKIQSSVIDQLFMCILNGLQIHGAEISAQGSLLTAALNMYIGLRVNYPSLVHIMLKVPSCKQEKLKKFDLDVFEAECKLTEKRKRECFRVFLSDIFGKSLSEAHKADIKIKDLPPLAPRTKPTPSEDGDISNLTGLFG